MRRTSSTLVRAALMSTALLAVQARPADATTEICGNGIDDDGNGMTDEGCYPTLTTSVCESPLSCGDTGMVSWSTGSLHYDLPPDIAPAVPYGPGIGLRRFFTSMDTAATNPTSVNHTPMGPHWNHTYMTWVYVFTDGGGTHRIVHHTSQGRDVYYTRSTVNGCIETYTPQAGDHVLSMTNDTCKTVTTVQLLTGEKLLYNNVGQIYEIDDTLSTPNAVSITWTSTTNGNVSTVTDASGERRLQFNYTNNLLTSVYFQTLEGTTWTTQHTTSYDYANGITQDATSGWFVPQSTTEWNNLLAGTGIAAPSHLWKLQEGSGNPADSIGATTLTNEHPANITYQTSVTGWSRKSIAFANNTTALLDNTTDTSLPDVSTTSIVVLALIAVTGTPATALDVMQAGGTNDGPRAAVANPMLPRANVANHAATGTSNVGSTVRPWLLRYNKTASSFKLEDDLETVTDTFGTPTSSKRLAFGAAHLSSVGMNLLYATAWQGTNAELTDPQAQAMINRVKSGPGLHSVTIGGTLAQQYTYDVNGLLSQIVDGSGNQIVAFSYSSTSTGEVDLIATSRGTVGFEYSTSRSGCTAGNTVLFFNQGNSSSCSVDSDCGSGYMCGGKTGTGATGKCFLAARCITKSTVNGESVITNVAPLGPGGGSCSGACTDVMAYAWTASGSGNVNVIGLEDPLTNFTAISYNSNGLPTQISYGATDSTGTSANRIEYIVYDGTFPGRTKEVRRQSDIDTTDTCPAPTPNDNPSGCYRTLYCYGSSCDGKCADGVLCSTEQKGYTLTSTGTQTTYDNTITYYKDANGRIKEIDGAGGTKTTFTFFAKGGSADGTTDNFLSGVDVYSDATHYLPAQITKYDFWGHATSLKAPDGNFTCDTYDPSFGFLSSRRRAMDNQTDCTTTNSLDITTSWARDSWQRLTQLTRPDGSCVFYAYDSSGRMSSIKRRDDCTSTSSGDTQTFSYTQPGGAGCPGIEQICEVDTYDASNSLTAKQPYTYFAGRQVQDIVNPVDTTKFTGLVYDSAGKVTEVDGAGSLSKTVYHFDRTSAPGRDDRVTSEERFKTTSTSDTWSLLYSWMGIQAQVTDGDSKVTGSTRDDLGRLVKLTSPDLAGPTIRVYDGASRLTNLLEDEGGGPGNEVDSVFTYDSMGRQLTADYGPRCTANLGTNHETITRVFDAPAACPSNMTYNTCPNTAGRLAYVQTVLMCSSIYTDGSLDQQTWFAYDQAGRVLEEYTTDDAGRIADTLYFYDKDGGLIQVTTPSATGLGWNYGSTGNNSDTDLVTSIWRSSTTSYVIDTVAYFPFGPWNSFNWEAKIGTTTLQNKVDRNVAYRVSVVHGALQGSTENAKVAITEDAMGRVTSRVYTPHDPTLSGLFDSYFMYDEQSRVLCEATTSGTCPTSGSTLKNNHDQSVPFTNAGDWKEILRPIPGSTGGVTNNFNSTGTYGTSHQVTDVNQSDGTPSLGHTAFAYDGRGLRSYDDNTTSLTHDRRDYTYDGRRNVINVRGQYYTGSAWHYYDVVSAFDHKNRRVFKSFKDESTGKQAQWFFYYDIEDRLTEVQYTPDISVLGTYSFFQLFWLGNKLVLYWQSDYVSSTLSATSKRYVASDETDRPIQLWNWPSSGDATRVWAINPSAWGFDKIIIGPTLYQPVLFAGQYSDTETIAFQDDGSTRHRPALCQNRYRTYDPFVGGYCQLDPLVQQTKSSYVYANSDPIGDNDPLGLGTCFCGCTPSTTPEGQPTESCGCDLWDCVGLGGDGGPPPDPNGSWCKGVCKANGAIGESFGCNCEAPPPPPSPPPSPPPAPPPAPPPTPAQTASSGNGNGCTLVPCTINGIKTIQITIPYIYPSPGEACDAAVRRCIVVAPESTPAWPTPLGGVWYVLITPANCKAYCGSMGTGSVGWRL